MALYCLFDVPPHGFHAAARSLIEKSSGFNVTTPYKEDAARLLPELSHEASLTGSVNLVRNNMGYNTDYIALEGLLNKTGLGLSGKDCTIFGSGGAARAAAYLLGGLKMHVTIINRSLERAQKLEAGLADAGMEARAVKLNAGISSETMESEVVVNCISYPEFRFPEMRAKLAVDFNYSSRSGDFRSKVHGNHSMITGEEILVSQAIHSQRIWNNLEPDFGEIMEVINVKHTG